MKIFFIFHFFKPRRAIGVVGKLDWTKIEGHWEGPLFLEDIKCIIRMAQFHRIKSYLTKQ